MDTSGWFTGSAMAFYNMISSLIVLIYSSWATSTGVPIIASSKLCEILVLGASLKI